jgi:exosortase J
MATVPHLGEMAAPSQPLSRPAVPLVSMLAALAVLVGAIAMLPLWATAWELWISDPLRSVGRYFPLLALVGVLVAWRRLTWQLHGSYWGAPLAALAIVAARAFHTPSISLVLFGHPLPVLHAGLALFAYGVGAVLAVGGWPLLRASILPLCLLLAINPVPWGFNTHFDLPLQQISANTARAFAHAIGLRPTGEQLRMMFAPDFGMEIVPGCNGVRGAVTFGYLAMIVAYTRGFRLRWIACFGLAGLMTGYLFNLLRLCVLVLYYRLGLSLPSIQNYGAQVDYAIGCTLFLLATTGLGLAVFFLQQRMQARRAQHPGAVAPTPADATTRLRRGPLLLFAVVVVFFVAQVHAVAATNVRPTLDAALHALPQSVGSYRLERTWWENLPNGKPAGVYGDYADAVTGRRLTLGLWLADDYHLIVGCRRDQGIEPQHSTWVQLPAANGGSLRMLESFYDDGITRTLDAETSCSAHGCSDESSRPGRSLVVTAPPMLYLVAPPARRVPLVIQRETIDTATPVAAFTEQFQADADTFARHLDLERITAIVR